MDSRKALFTSTTPTLLVPEYIPSQEKRPMSGVIPNYTGGNSDVMFVQW
jgi:hypothetical protein